MIALYAALPLALAALSVIAASAGDSDTQPSESRVPGSALVDPPEITDSISREFTVFVEQAGEVVDAISREFTVFSGSDATPTDAISREFTVFNDLVNPVEFTDAVSREMSAFVVIPIELGVPYEGALLVGSQVYFRLDTPPDVTVRINLDHASDTAWTELYASFGSPPNGATAEFVFSNPSEPDQELVIPNTLGGSYFVLVRMTAESDPAASSAFTLLAAGVPFGVDSVQPPTVGAGEEVTVRVAGGHLDTAASIYLRHAASATEITPVKTDVLDAAHARLRFSLLGAELGSYHVISESQDGQEVRLEDSLTLEPPDEFQLDQQAIASPFIRSGHGRNHGITTITLTNNMNVDVPIAALTVFAPNGPDMDLTIEGADEIPLTGNDEWLITQVLFESIPPSEHLEVSVRIDVGPGFPGPNVQVYAYVETYARQAFRDIWLLSEQGLVQEVAEAYAATETEDVPAEFWTEVVPAMQEHVAALFDEYGLEIPGTDARSARAADWPSKQQLCNASCALLTAECGIVCSTMSPVAQPWCIRYCTTVALWCVLCCNDACNNVCPRKWVGLCAPPPPDDGCERPCGGDPNCPASCVCRKRCFPDSDGVYYSENCREVCGCSQAICTPGGRSTDPNEKVGPTAHGEQRFVNTLVPMTYRLYFENLETATAPAAEVFITDPLDPSMDVAAFRVRQFQFGSTTVDVPEGRSSYQTTIDLTAEMNLLVQFQAGVDPETGYATFVLRALDPETLQLPAELMRGFLPPNDETGRGEGYVEFTITPNASTPTGTVITNGASIVFDYNDPIETNEVFHTIDSGAPESSVMPLPSESLTPFFVEWDGVDDIDGSGIDHYEVFVSTDGGPFELWRSSAGTWSYFVGEVGRTYAFYTRGVDNVGNVEALPTQVDVATTVTGRWLDCLTGPAGPLLPGCETADLDSDNDVDLRDFAALQHPEAPVPPPTP